jgi:WD40 repeat protein
MDDWYFPPDGKLLATSFQRGKIQIWNTANVSLIQTLFLVEIPFNESPIVEFTFSPDGRILAPAALGVIQYW